MLHPSRVMLAAVVLLAALITYLSIGVQSTTAVSSHETPHVMFTATVSPRIVTPGQPFTLAMDVVPKPGIHVYAPGSKYRPIRITVEPQTALTIKNAVYPKATPYHFKPLNETVDVYESAFQLLVEMKVNAGGQVPASLALEGTLEYQACDDRECFLPETIPWQWALRLRRDH